MKNKGMLSKIITIFMAVLMLASAMTIAGCAEEKSKEKAKANVTETQKPQKTQEELEAE